MRCVRVAAVAVVLVAGLTAGLTLYVGLRAFATLAAMVGSRQS